MKQNLLKVFLSIMLMIIGMNAFADEVEISSFTAVSGDMDDYVSYAAAKGTARAAPAINSNEIRVYQNGGTFTVSTKNDAIITAIELGSSMATTVTYAIDGGTTSDNQSITAGGKLSLSDLNVSSNVLFTCTGTSKTARLYVNYLKVTYTKPSTTKASAPSLSATATFTTSTYDVTITNNESGATVYYTTDGNDPTTSSENFTGDSKTITIDGTTTVKAMAAIDGKDNSSVASATYTYEKSIANTEETAYTTAEAIALIDAGSTQLTSTEVYVKGTISKVDSYNSTYGSITYWLDNDAFEVYSGLSIDGAKFTGATDLQVGDEVVVKGIIKKYSSTYEFDKNNVLISRKTTATQVTPTFTLGTYKTSMLTTDESDSYSVTTNSDGALSATSSAENVATVSIEGTTVTVTPVAAGTTTITIATEATNTYYAASKSYTLTVTAPAKPAELPFSFDGGASDVATTQGMSQTGLGSDYSASPKLKFDTTGDNLVINFEKTDNPYLMFTVKGNGLNIKDSTSPKFEVMESEDGTNYTTIKEYSSIPDAIVEVYALQSTTSYVKFVYTTKASGNVAIGDIHIGNALTRETASGKYGTICAPNAFAAAGATIYSASVSGNYVTLTKVTKTDAGTPYIYQATTDAQTFLYTSTDNLTTPVAAAPLVGVLAETEIPVGSYVMQTQGDVQQFYKVEESGLKLSANKAYLDGEQVSGAKSLSIGFADEEATGIKAVNALVDGTAKIYDLNGRELKSLQKGVNIVNGVKVLVK